MLTRRACPGVPGCLQISNSPASKGQALTFPSLHHTAAFTGQPQKVIMTSAPLKREGILASTVSPSSVVIASAAITRVRALA